MIKRVILSVVIVLTLINTSIAQSKYEVDNQKSKLKVLGSSTMHDWDATAHEVFGKAEINVKNSEVEIHSLSFKLKGESLKSEKSGMEKDMYEALDTKQHPWIVYQFKKIIGMEDGILSTSGTLTVAGTSKIMEIPVEVKKTTDEVTFMGEIAFKMSEFGIEPPTAVFGVLKTDDEVTVNFNIVYKVIQ
ncbi:YceI family protein [Fulvivirga sediminis]|uniref:YceI family protein n=1 Tax=Fulvivirga sediminis TaxID=2803949 RepID=A0A937K2C5_9BACT|nr:YceI family protein [Fulvivirga sediminis]MBL3658225.1 YceI family protein [Fulvivirga sediminis]